MNLTKPQKLIYDMEKFAGGSISVLCGSMLVCAENSAEEMQKAVNELYRLNDALRIKVSEKNGQPHQWIAEYEEQEVEVLSFDCKKELDEYASSFAKEPFDLYGSLCDLKIIILPDKRGILVKLHHLISDAWTISLIGTQFNKILNNEEPQAYSYVDYVNAEEKYIEGKRYIKDKEYFISQFKKCEEVTFLSEKQDDTFESQRISFVIEKGNFSKILAFAEEKNVSVLSLFLSAIAILINKTKSNVAHFYIGSSVLNRSGAKEQNTMGMFINTAPILMEPDNESSFEKNLDAVDSSVISVLRHQKYNYGTLLGELRENQNFNQKLYDVIVNYQNAKIFGNEVETTWYHNGMQVESLQINIDDRDCDGIFRIHYDYRIDKFCNEEIIDLHEHIFKLLFDALENPHKKIADLEILSAEEKQKILVEFNDTAVDYDRNKCVYELFEEQVARTPDKTAVVAVDKTLTYKELNEEANRIAHSLMEKGIGRGDIVGLMLPRKSSFLSALFGILKTGAAYLPSDPDHPGDRVEYILADSNAKFCITEENIAQLAANEQTENPARQTQSTDRCYCIYTSGSTGVPKGTLISHRNLVWYVSSLESIYGKQNINMPLFTSQSVDLTVTSVFFPLLTGGTVYPCNEELLQNLADIFSNKEITLLKLTPTHIDIICQHIPAAQYSNLRYLIVGGEQLYAKSCTEFLNKFGHHIEIHNEYGPTETTVGCMDYIFDPNTTDSTVPVGHPNNNVQLYITDKYMNPVPIGVTGELCIAGDGVGAGYLNRPDLTVEKFIDNPFGDGKLYKTGDLAYWREDGNIVFVGRNDFQVKIRGLRIELGEIEKAITAVDGIVSGVVVVRKDKTGRQLICAFYTGEKKSAQELRAEIGKHLPKYMIPHIFMHLENMPMTTSGKINRNALPGLDLENTTPETEYVAPVTDMEILLVDCIKDALGAEKVSVLDNFFDIGGDSLQAIELTARLEAKGYTVSVKTIFASKDIASLASELIPMDEEETVAYGNVLPATAAQMRAYTAQMMNPDATHYNVPFAFKVRDLNTDRLEKALNKLIERHESLRTRFENRNGQIVQIIEDRASIRVEQLESEDISFFNTPFDLTRAPLIRVGFCRNTVMIILHHIIADGESISVFHKELNELYMERTLPDTVQYGSFAINDKYTPESEQYWLQIFGEEIVSTDLPADFERPAVQSVNGSQIYAPIEKQLHNQITQMCRELNITPFVFYMACYTILLSKLSGNEDVVVGVPISGRTSRFLKTMGMFVNTIALRSHPKGNKTVLELLQQIRESSVEAIDNQNYPFGELVKKLNLNISNRNPIFDVMFAYQSEQLTNIVFADQEATVVAVTLGGAKCDLNFSILPRSTDTVLMAEYCTDLFRKETVIKWMGFYKSILTQALDCAKSIRDIEILGAEEKQKVLVEFNNTQHSYAIEQNATLYSLFEKTAEENADKICIRTADKDITFGELRMFAGRLDSNIRCLTAHKKSVIAVIADRSVEMYAAVYGIIRGGNAYLPIDPAYPQNRIEHILTNSNAAAIAAQGQYTHLAGAVPCIDMTAFINKNEAGTELPSCVAQADDTAYVIYTSGSTGNPKGAKVSHRSALNRILWMHDKYPLKKNDVILQKTPYTFDVSVWELFWWGLCAGSLAVSKPGEHFLPAKILDETDKNKVTHLHFVPSVFEIFLQYLETHKEEVCKFDSVRYVFLSGEALTANLTQRFYALFDYNKVSLHNLYGPTECAVDVTYYDCTPTDIDPIPIGKPIYNTQMYVVDKYMNPVPVGVTGELCIGGTNVGQGYLNNPELTAEKFIDNPFGSGKLYKTGDLAYWREDGNIIFVGRMDGQIKLHGQRIEIGEIESVISAVAAVQAVAVVLKTLGERQMLAAYYCAATECEEEIRSHCEMRLPHYMVPSVFVRLESIPLNASGKTDRKQLVQMAVQETVIERDVQTAKNEEERKICELFSAELGVPVGRNENFFACGGTSLSMISLLSQPYFADVSAADFIANATPAKMALFMKNKQMPDFSTLQLLHGGKNAKNALVLFPYAGGDAASFARLVQAIAKRTKDYDVYFVPFLHTENEFTATAHEIELLAKQKRICFYSHCVGSAVAIGILRLLETEEKQIVSHFVVGANIPLAKPSVRNIWRCVPKKAVLALLQRAGAPFKGLASEQKDAILDRFLLDTDVSVEVFSAKHEKLHCPVSLIMSKEDIFTRNYKEAIALWKQYVQTVRYVHYIDAKTHYFQAAHSDETAAILLSVFA